MVGTHKPIIEKSQIIPYDFVIAYRIANKY